MGGKGAGQQDRDHVEGGGPQKVQMWKVLKDIFCSNIGRSRDRTEKSPVQKFQLEGPDASAHRSRKNASKKSSRAPGLSGKLPLQVSERPEFDSCCQLKKQF